MRKSLPALFILPLVLTLTACGGGGDSSNTATDSSGTGAITGTPYSKVARSALPAGDADCPAGGILVKTGFDSNGNGNLDTDEVVTSEKVCNGVSGEQVIVDVATEAVGSNCAAGGQKVTGGVDTNGSGTLDAAEVLKTSYICDGRDGAAGNDGYSTLNQIVTVGAGAQCAAGGVRIDTGRDTNRNNVLDSSEVQVFGYVCNGTNGTNGIDGLSSLVNVATEAAGANCSSGGQKIEVGTDSNHNGVLDASEVVNTSYVCNGEPSDYPVLLASEHRSDVCLHGGTVISSGPDINGNEVLDSAEIVSTSTVCTGNTAPALGGMGLLLNRPEADRISVWLSDYDQPQSPFAWAYMLAEITENEGDAIDVLVEGLPAGLEVFLSDWGYTETDNRNLLVARDPLVAVADGLYPLTVTLSDGEASRSYRIDLHLGNSQLPQISYHVEIIPGIEGLPNPGIARLTFSEPLPSPIALFSTGQINGNAVQVCPDGDWRQCQSPSYRPLPAGTTSVDIRYANADDDVFAPQYGWLDFEFVNIYGPLRLTLANESGTSQCDSYYHCSDSVLLWGIDDDGSAEIGFTSSTVDVGLVSLLLDSNITPADDISLWILALVSGESSTGDTFSGTIAQQLTFGSGQAPSLTFDIVEWTDALLDDWALEFQLLAAGYDSAAPGILTTNYVPPAAPQLMVEVTGIKTFTFSWPAVTGATHYRLLKNSDGVSGYTQEGSDFAGTSVSVELPLHLHDWINSSYIVEACNASICRPSDAAYLTTEQAVAAIGYFKASYLSQEDYFGWSVALSGDGNTLAIGAPGEDSNATGVNGDQSNDSGGESGAVYVFTRSGTTWNQQAYIKRSYDDSSSGTGNDSFGHSIALSADGDTLAVGAYRERSSATGINGDQADNSSLRSGAVYVFTRNDSAWSQQAYIKASNTDAYDYFGYSVAMSADGNSLAVGAFGEDSNAIGVNSNQDDNSAADSGAVYTFVRAGDIWSQQAYIKASNTEAGDYFGWRIALSSDGNTLAVSAYLEDSIANAINGNQADNSASNSGAVYVFIRSGSNWGQQAYIKASNAEAGDYFGSAVAISADRSTLAVGASGERSAATGVNDNQLDNSMYEAGAVYLFTRAYENWSQQAYIKASNTASYERFGVAISLVTDGNTLAVGASSGGVYVLSRSDDTWSHRANIKSPNTGESDQFGSHLSISADGSTLAVGAFGESGSATGINNGDHANNPAGPWQSGAAFLY